MIIMNSGTIEQIGVEMCHQLNRCAHIEQIDRLSADIAALSYKFEEFTRMGSVNSSNCTLHISELIING